MIAAAPHRGGTLLPRTTTWLGRNIAPLVLLPLAALLLWVAIWRVWLPGDGPGTGVVKTVTSTQRSGSVGAGTSVVTVERATSGAPPSRRSETLVVVLLVLAVGSAGVGVFHRQLASVELGADGLKITLTHGEKQGLAELVGALHTAGATPVASATSMRWRRYERLRRNRLARPGRCAPQPSLETHRD